MYHILYHEGALQFRPHGVYKCFARFSKQTAIVSLNCVKRPTFNEDAAIVARQRPGKNPLIVARQQLGRKVTAVTNTHATREELLDA
jgi:hypothetical protein